MIRKASFCRNLLLGSSAGLLYDHIIDPSHFSGIEMLSPLLDRCEDREPEA